MVPACLKARGSPVSPVTGVVPLVLLVEVIRGVGQLGIGSAPIEEVAEGLLQAHYCLRGCSAWKASEPLMLCVCETQNFNYMR